LFSPDSKYLAISAKGENPPSWWGRAVTINLWSISDKKITEIDNQQKSFINSVVFSPDSKKFATSGGDGMARLWDISGQQLTEFKGHQGSVNSVAFSTDGKLLATSGDDATARLWDTSGKQLSTIQTHQGNITSAVFSPNGKHLATSGNNSSTTRLWQVGGIDDLLKKTVAEYEIISKTRLQRMIKICAAIFIAESIHSIKLIEILDV
jgi:WD40 repeat protein